MNERILFVVALLLLILVYSVIEVVLALLFSIGMKMLFSRSDLQDIQEYDINLDVDYT